MPDSEASKAYRFLVVSYMESTGSYHSKYRSDEGRSSKFYSIKFYDEDEVKNHIFGLELDQCIEGRYTSITFLWYNHYIHTAENTFGPACDEYGWYYDYNSELPESWQKEIMGRVNADLRRREVEKEVARLAKDKEDAIIREQEEKKLYYKLRTKYSNP